VFVLACGLHWFGCDQWAVYIYAIGSVISSVYESIGEYLNDGLWIAEQFCRLFRGRNFEHWAGGAAIFCFVVLVFVNYNATEIPNFGSNLRARTATLTNGVVETYHTVVKRFR
jgi:hypothetical protein